MKTLSSSIVAKYLKLSTAYLGTSHYDWKTGRPGGSSLVLTDSIEKAYNDAYKRSKEVTKLGIESDNRPLILKISEDYLAQIPFERINGGYKLTGDVDQIKEFFNVVSLNDPTLREFKAGYLTVDEVVKRYRVKKRRFPYVTYSLWGQNADFSNQTYLYDSNTYF